MTVLVHSPAYSPASPSYSPTAPSCSSASPVLVPAALPMAGYTAMISDGFEGVAPPQPIAELSTTIKTSSLASTFTVEGLSTIPSDGVTHTVSIAVGLEFEAEVTRVAIPRLGAEVYLQCKVKNVSEYRLLPGSVSIFLDEGYASKTVIPVSHTQFPVHLIPFD